MSVTIRIYGLFLDALRAMAPLAQRFAPARQWDIPERLAGPADCSHRARNSAVVWIHGASLGESKLACSFLSTLENKHPGGTYLLTATTRTGVDYLTSRSDGHAVAGVGFMPIDSPTLIQRTIRRFGVSRVWLMETELWPGLLWTCRRMGIPVGVVNARMEEKSFRRFNRIGSILKPLFETLNPVLAQNERYARRFEILGTPSESLHIVRNLKARVTVARPPAEEWKAVRNRLAIDGHDFVVTAGCLHPGEGHVVRTMLVELQRHGIEAKCIVVPRHLKAAPAMLAELGEGVLHLSETACDRSWRVCLIEKIGILDKMYMICDAAVMGGTFVDVGGHNVWEAARYGVPVFLGPDYHTQTEDCTRLIEAGVGFETRDGADLAQTLVRVTRTNARTFIEAQQTFIKSMDGNRSALEHYLP